MSALGRLPFLFTLLSCLPHVASLLLSTSTRLEGVSAAEAHRFLASPANWPAVVLSSHSVESASAGSAALDEPLGVGERVTEVFGAPPLLPLRVTWTCVLAEPPARLEFQSEDGLDGIARNCCMRFRVENVESASGDGGVESSRVTLEMGYEPISPLATLATPLLRLDNELALSVGLPNAIREQRRRRREQRRR